MPPSPYPAQPFEPPRDMPFELCGDRSHDKSLCRNHGAGENNVGRFPLSTHTCSLTDICLFTSNALGNILPCARAPRYRGEPHGWAGRLHSQVQTLSADFPSSPRERMAASHRSTGRRPLIPSVQDRLRKRNSKKSQRAVRDAIGR